MTTPTPQQPLLPNQQPGGGRPGGPGGDPAAGRSGARRHAAGSRAGAGRRAGTDASPIIPPGIQPALLTAVLAALTAGAALLGRPALAVPAVLAQALTAAGWFRLNGMWPARQGIALAFLAGLVADAALLATSTGSAPTVLAGTLGAWMPLVLVLHLRHHGSADERLSSLTATAAATLLTVLAAGFLAHGGRLMAAGAVAVGLAALVRALPLPGVLTVPAALAAGTAGGCGAARLAHLTGPVLPVAAAGAVCALIGLRVASYDRPSRFVHLTAGVVLPLALAAPVVWAAARLG